MESLWFVMSHLAPDLHPTASLSLWTCFSSLLTVGNTTILCVYINITMKYLNRKETQRIC